MNVVAKRVRTILVILLLLPIVAVVGTLVFLASPLGEEFIRREAITRLEALTDLDIEIGDVSTSLFTHLTLSDVHVRHRSIAPDQDLLAFSRLTVQYDLLPLMSKVIRVDSVAVDSLASHLVMNESGELNIPVFPPDTTQTDTTASEPFPYRLSLGGARIHLAHASYDDAIMPLAAQLDNMVIHATGKLGGRYNYLLNWDQAQLDSDGRQLVIEDFLLGGRLLGDTLRVDTLYAHTPGAELAGHAKAELEAGADSSQFVAAGVRFNADLALLSRHFGAMLPSTVQPLIGQLALDATVSGSTTDTHFTANLTSDRIQVGDLVAADLLLSAHGSASKVDLDQLQVDVLDGQVRANGSVELDSLLTHTFELQLDNIDLLQVQESIASFTPVSDTGDDESSLSEEIIAGRLHGGLKSSGMLSQPWSLKADGGFAADMINPLNNTSETVSLELDYNDHVADINLQHGETQIEAHARVEPDQIDGDFNLQIPKLGEIARVAGVVGVAGKLRGQGTFSGHPSNPSVTASISSPGIMYQGFPVDSLLAVVSYDSSRITVEQSYLVGLLDGIDSTNAPFGVTDLRGGFSYEGRVSGRVPDLDGAFEFNTWDLAFGDISTDYIDTRIRLRRNRLELTKLQIAKDDLKLTMQGNYAIADSSGELSLWFAGPDLNGSIDGRLNLNFALLDSQRFRVRGHGQNINLADVPQIHPAVLGLGGVLGTDLEFEGSAQDPHGSVSLSIDSLQAADFVIDSLFVSTSFDSTHLKSDLRTIIQAGSPLTAAIVLPLERSEAGLTVAMDTPIQGEIVGNDIRLTFLNKFMPDGMSLDGLMTISYNIAGTLTSPSVLGELNLDDGRVVLGEDQPTLESLKANITQWDSTIYIERIALNTIGHDFHLSGELSVLDSMAVHALMDVKVDTFQAIHADAHYTSAGYNAEIVLTELPLAPVKNLAPDISSIGGIITGTISVEGDTGLPRIKGSVQGSGIRLASKQIKEKLHEGEFSVQIDNESVLIDTLTARFGDKGRLIVDGRADLQEQKPYFDLRVRGTNIGLEQDDYTLWLDGMTLNFDTNENNRHVLSGDVHLGETRYVRDYRLDTILRSMNAAPTRQLQKPNEITDNIELDLRLREADQLWVDNNLAKVRMDANISVIGTVNDPMITGRLALDDGYVMYLDRKFVIEEGIVDFVDTREINPYLNIVANSTVIDYEQGEQFTYDVTLIITGNARSATIDLTSDPYLEQSNILSLLTFGTPNTGQGGVGSQAGALAGRAVSSYVGATLGNAIGLESVSVQGNLFAPEESGATLLATKEISDRAEITYITNVSGFNENSIRVTYFLNKNWTISGETNQEGEGSLDLKLKVRWNEIRWQ
jgi:autotransporter translocation and assembly factor TamB